MKNKFKSIIKILMITAGCLWFASFSPSLDGRAVVVDGGVFPQGLFAKTVGYLPGDIISVTNISGDKSVDLLVIGALDPSEGVAIMLSPEAADAIGIDKTSNNIVKITKRSGQDERVYGNAVISKSTAENDDFDDGSFEKIGAEENSDAFAEPEIAKAEPEPVEEPAVEETPAPIEETITPVTEESTAPVVAEAPAVEEIAAPEEAEEPEEEILTPEELPEESIPEETLEEENLEDEAFEEENFEEEAFDEAEPEALEAPVEEAFDEPEPEALEAPVEETAEKTEEAEAPLEDYSDLEEEGIPLEEAPEEEFDEELPAEDAFEEEAPAEEFVEEPAPAFAEDEIPAEEFVEEPAPAFAEDELPAEEFVEEAPADLPEELPEEEYSEEEPAPVEEEEYEAIVLVPADSNPPEPAESEDLVDEVADADEDEVEDLITDEVEEINEDTITLVPETVENPVESESRQPAKTYNGSYDKYMVPSLKSLQSGKYYIQIAVYAKDENINEIIEKYGTNYPITIVPMAGGVSKQILIGPLSMDEYKVVLERFKSYGFNDAFLRKVR